MSARPRNRRPDTAGSPARASPPIHVLRRPAQGAPQSARAPRSRPDRYAACRADRLLPLPRHCRRTEPRTPSPGPHGASQPPSPASLPRPRRCRRRRERTGAIPCRSASIGVPAGNTVSMWAESSARRTPEPFPGHVPIALPTCVDVRILKSQLTKTLAQPLGPRALAKRRRRHAHHLRLPLQDSLLLQVQPLERLMHAAISREPGDRCGCGRRGSHRSFQRSTQRPPADARAVIARRRTPDESLPLCSPCPLW